MNNIISKKIFTKNKINTPKYFVLQKKEFNNLLIKKNITKQSIYYPVVVKPVNEGSSLGVELCKSNQSLFKASKKLFKKYDQLIFEEYKGGQEIQVAVIDKNPIGAIELVPKRLFYDYKAKYTKEAKTEHIMPARFNKKNTLKF